MDGGRGDLSDSCGKLIQKSASVYRNVHAAGRVHNKHRVPEDKINDYFAAIVFRTIIGLMLSFGAAAIAGGLFFRRKRR